EILAHGEGLLTDANRAAFSEARLANFPEELAAAHKLREMGTRSFYVFGDAPILYLLLPGPSPFHVNNYNGSPVSAQLNVINWLERTKPDVVLLDPTYFNFDSVAVSVRVPILLQAIVRNYVPTERFGRFYLLRPKTPDQPIPLGEWQNLLGANIDFGH